MRPARWILGLVLTLGACGSERGAAGERPASDDAARRAAIDEVAVDVDDGEAGRSTSTGAEPAEVAPSEPAAVDDGAASARRAALSEADAALGRGDAAAAIAACDRALAAVDDDAEALVRRGEALLAAGELAGAEVDLRRALAASTDPEVRARAALALGERLAAGGDPERAQIAFKEAARLAPSRAAKAKLHGSAVDRACAFVDRTELRAVDLDGWVALAEALGLAVAEGDADGREAAARFAACGEGGCVGEPPWPVLGTGSLAVVEPRGERLRSLILPRVDVDLGGDPGACERSASLLPGPILRVVDRAACTRRELVDRCDPPAPGCLARIARRLEVVDEHVLRARPLGGALRLRRSRVIDGDDDASAWPDDGIELTLADGAALVRGRGCSLKASVLLAQ